MPKYFLFLSPAGGLLNVFGVFLEGLESCEGIKERSSEDGYPMDLGRDGDSGGGSS